MSEVDWRDRFPDEVTCVRCLEVTPVQALDRVLWCESCIETARRRATIRGWIAGSGLALVLAIYIWFVIQPNPELIPSAWVAVVVVALYLGSRVARELIFGLDRISNRKAAEAVPPSAPLE